MGDRLDEESYYLPGLSLMKTHKRWEGYRQTLDKKRGEIFGNILFELAGRREAMLVNHPDLSEFV